jgi:hypothetical protein
MTIETAVIAGSILASVASVSAVVGDMLTRRSRHPPPKRTVTVTIDDPLTGIVRTFARSARRAEVIRRDIERAIRGGS